MDWLDKLIEFEGMTTWMYLDVARPPVVTCGIGHALRTVDCALKLAWDKTPDIVQRDYKVIKSCPPGHMASWYAQFTSSRLSPSVVRAIAQEDLEKARKAFCNCFPEYPIYPESVREALDDMMFNLGPYWLVEKNAEGKLKWPKLREAVDKKDWLAAAASCHRAAPICEARNAYVVELFKHAC